MSAESVRLQRNLVKECLFPPPKSDFEMITEMQNESVYESHKTARVGKYPLLVTVPHHAVDSCFGKPIMRSEKVEGLLYPSATDVSVYHSTQQDLFEARSKCESYNEHKTVSKKMTATEYGVKELIHLGNEDPCFAKMQEQRQTKNIKEDYVENLHMQCTGQCYPLHATKTLDHFIKPHKPIKMNFKSKEGIVNTVWNRLKMKNFHHFDDLESAFNAYDKNNAGKISAANIEEVCKLFGIAVPFEIADALLSACDRIDRDGYLSFEEFCLFLNWSDKLPLRKKSKETVMFQSEAKVPVCPEILNNYKSVTSLFEMPDKKWTKSVKPAGIPNIRVDLPVPAQRSFTNTVDYGEAAGIGPILQPTIFNSYGVYETDLVTPRQKNEIEALLFMKDKAILTSEVLEHVWRNVSQNGKASMENILSALSDNSLLKQN